MAELALHPFMPPRASAVFFSLIDRMRACLCNVLALRRRSSLMARPSLSRAFGEFQNLFHVALLCVTRETNDQFEFLQPGAHARAHTEAAKFRTGP